jgi:hypothetical protein
LLNQNKDELVLVGNGNLTRSGNSNPTNYNSPPLPPPIIAPEPDLVASCMGIKQKVISSPEKSGIKQLPAIIKMPAPVAPPRRKRRGLEKTQSEDGGGESSREVTPLRENAPYPFPTIHSINQQQLHQRPCSSSSVSSPNNNPPSPTVSIRSVCRELDKTLELEAASQQRIFVVKAQDEEKTRAKNSGPKMLRRTESLPKDVIAAFDPSGSGSGGHREKQFPTTTTTSTTNSVNNQNPPILNPSAGVDSSPVVAPAITSIKDSSSTTIVDKKRHSLSSSEKNLKIGGTHSRSNSAPKTGIQLSSIVSAIAAMEERRDSDGAFAHQFNMIRTRTDSGKLLSDIEILEQVQVSQGLVFD